MEALTVQTAFKGAILAQVVFQEVVKGRVAFKAGTQTPTFQTSLELAF